MLADGPLRLPFELCRKGSIRTHCSSVRSRPRELIAPSRASTHQHLRETPKSQHAGWSLRSADHELVGSGPGTWHRWGDRCRRTSWSRRTWPARSQVGLEGSQFRLVAARGNQHFALATGAMRRRVHGVVVGCAWEVVQSSFVHPAWVMLGARPTRTLCRLHSNVGGGVRSWWSARRPAAATGDVPLIPTVQRLCLGVVDDARRSPERIPASAAGRRTFVRASPPRKRSAEGRPPGGERGLSDANRAPAQAWPVTGQSSCGRASQPPPVVSSEQLAGLIHQWLRPTRWRAVVVGLPTAALVTRDGR